MQIQCGKGKVQNTQLSSAKDQLPGMVHKQRSIILGNAGDVGFGVSSVNANDVKIVVININLLQCVSTTEEIGPRGPIGNHTSSMHPRSKEAQHFGASEGNNINVLSSHSRVVKQLTAEKPIEPNNC